MAPIVKMLKRKPQRPKPSTIRFAERQTRSYFCYIVEKQYHNAARVAFSSPEGTLRVPTLKHRDGTYLCVQFNGHEVSRGDAELRRLAPSITQLLTITSFRVLETFPLGNKFANGN